MPNSQNRKPHLDQGEQYPKEIYDPGPQSEAPPYVPYTPSESSRKPHLEAGEEYPKEIYNPPAGDEVPHYVPYMEKAQSGLRSIKLIVYSGMVAFSVMTVFLFYLIAQLTEDASRMAHTMEQMQKTMDPMGHNMAVMTQSVVSMAESTNRIQYSAGHMDRSLTPQGMFSRMMPFGGGGGERTYYPPTPFVPTPPLQPAAGYTTQRAN